MLGKLLVAVVMTASLLTLTQHPASADVGAPSWWSGDCDANHWNSAATAQGWKGAGAHRLGASYLGVPVCGPRSGSDGAPDVLWTRSGWGHYEWECTELVHRFMGQIYGMTAYGGNGNNVVRNYNTSYGGGLVTINNGTVGKPPLPGDVMSFDSPTNSAGHAGVVASSSVNSQGNGSLQMLSQNDSVDGWRALTVTNWRVGSFGDLTPYAWLHDPAGRGGGLGNPIGSPVGYLDGSTGESGGLIDVKGWALDPDSPKKRVSVRVYLDGPVGTGRLLGTTVAGLARPDVGAAYPDAGKAHGYADAMGGVSAGTHAIYVYASNAAGDGADQLLGSSTVTVPPVLAGSPFGYLDTASAAPPGGVRVTGWAIDPDVQAQPVQVLIFIDGWYGSTATSIDLGKATVPRADVGAAYPQAGNAHGYDARLSGLTTGKHTIWSYAVNAGGNGGPTLLGLLTVVVT